MDKIPATRVPNWNARSNGQAQTKHPNGWPVHLLSRIPRAIGEWVGSLCAEVAGVDSAPIYSRRSRFVEGRVFVF